MIKININNNNKIQCKKCGFYFKMMGEECIDQYCNTICFVKCPKCKDIVVILGANIHVKFIFC